jgi:hypothetical protein
MLLLIVFQKLNIGWRRIPHFYLLNLRSETSALKSIFKEATSSIL